MHCVLGAYLLSGTPGYRQAGIHQYIRALLAEDANLDPSSNMVRCEDNLRITALVSPSARSELPELHTPSPLSFCFASHSTENAISRIRAEQWQTARVLDRIHADIYHGMAFVAPRNVPCPTVITVHDLSFITQPWTHKVLNRVYLSLATRWSCRRASRVIAVSEWTKRDVVSLLGVDPASVDVIPHGVHACFKPLPIDQVREFKLTHQIGDNAVFFLGSLEPRKNLTTLIEAFARLSPQDPALIPQLIIGGSLGWKYEGIYARVQALGVQPKVMFAGRITQEELPLWYNSCAVFAFPSIHEGFGMPVLEAMACGAPVVTSNVTALPEVAGNAGLLVAPTDVDALARALQSVLAEQGMRQRMSRLSLQRAAEFTWKRTAQLTIETYKQAATRTRRATS